MLLETTHAVKAPYGAVARRADGDYTAVDFICPTTGREYASLPSHPPIVHDDPVAPYLSVSCYWCDTERHVRGSPGFDRDKPQPHGYLLVETGYADTHR